MHCRWLIPLLGVISASALVVYIIASRLLPFSLFGLLSYVEPVLLLGVALLLGESIKPGEWLTYIPIWLAVVVLVFEGFKHSGAASPPYRIVKIGEQACGRTTGADRAGAAASARFLIFTNQISQWTSTPRRTWSRSIDSNSALKLPSPKPSSPLRWMNSKNTGPIRVSEKICSSRRLSPDSDEPSSRMPRDCSCVHRLAVVGQTAFEHFVVGVRRRGHEAHADASSGDPRS